MKQRHRGEGGRFAESFNISHTYIPKANGFSKFKDELEDAKGRMGLLMKEGRVEEYSGRIVFRSTSGGKLAEISPKNGFGVRRRLGLVVRKEGWFAHFWSGNAQRLDEQNTGVAYGVKGQDNGKVYILRGREAHLAFFSSCDSPRDWMYFWVDEQRKAE